MFLPPATKLGQGFVFTGVCDSVHRGGGSTWPGTPPGPGTPPWDQVHPPDQVPPDQVHPLDQVHPPGPGTPPGTRYNPSQTRYTPPGPGTPPQPGTPPPSAEHAGRYGQCAGGTHPTGMQSCLCFALIIICSRVYELHLSLNEYSQVTVEASKTFPSITTLHINGTSFLIGQKSPN